jgi:hypothetical protein
LYLGHGYSDNDKKNKNLRLGFLITYTHSH